MHDAAEWETVKARCPFGHPVRGTVVHVALFGVFVDLGLGFDGLLRVPELSDPPKSMDDFPKVGEVITAKVIHHDDRNRQVVLSQKDFVLTEPS